MQNKKVIIFVSIIILLVVAGLFQVKNNERSVPVESYTIAKAWWPAWDTLQIGLRRFEQANHSFHSIFLQTQDYGSALSDFQTNKADAATLTIYEALLAAAAGTPVKIVLLLDYTIGSDGLVAKKSIKSLADLVGKRIGVEKGTIAHFTVLKALQKSGLSPEDVKIDHFSNPELLHKAFEDGKIDAAGTFEPYMSTMSTQGNGHVIFSSAEIPRSICDVLFVKKNIARDHPELIDHWITAWNDALGFKKQEQEDFLQALSKLNGTSIADLKTAIEGIYFAEMVENRSAFGTPAKPGYLLDSLREMEAFMLKQGIIKQSLPLSEMIEFDGIRRFYNK